MNRLPIVRAVAFGLAAFVTLGVFAGVDRLVQHPVAAAEMASCVVISTRA